MRAWPLPPTPPQGIEPGDPQCVVERILRWSARERSPLVAKRRWRGPVSRGRSPATLAVGPGFAVAEVWVALDAAAATDLLARLCLTCVASVPVTGASVR